MASGPPDEANSFRSRRGVRAVRASALVAFERRCRWRTRDPRRSPWSTRCKERFERADAALLTEYRGLNVTALADLRRQLRPAGGEYKIYKNTLVRFAAQRGRRRGARGAADRPHGHRVRPRRRRRGGQDPAGLRPDQPRPGGQGRPAGHQGARPPPTSRPWPTCRPARSLLARLAGALQAPLREVRRPAPGPAPQLRLRPPGADRRPRRRACREAAAPRPTARRRRRRRPRTGRRRPPRPRRRAPTDAATDRGRHRRADRRPTRPSPTSRHRRGRHRRAHRRARHRPRPATPSDETDVPTASAEEE